MLQQYGLWIALACAVLAIAYGGWSISWILAKPAGNERMQEIAAAIQQGARAYLNRQYTTIGVVGVVLFVDMGFALHWTTADRIRRWRNTVGTRRLHRHEHLGTRERAYGRSSNM